MSQEDLSILARIARALFPEPEDLPETQHDFSMGLTQVPPHWDQVDGIRVARSTAAVPGGGGTQFPAVWVARPVVQIPRLHFTPTLLRLAQEGRPPDEPTVRDLLADPAVAAALPSVRLWGSEEFVYAREQDLGGRPDALVAFMNALEAARKAPWEALARKHRLTIDPRALSIFGTTGGLLGRRENFDIRIREERRVTRIRIAFPTPLPAGFAVRPGTPKPDEQLHDPIVDRKLVVTGVDRALRRQVLSIRDPLLNLLADRGESDIDHQRIRIVVPGRVLAELDALVADALAVARALTAPG